MQHWQVDYQASQDQDVGDADPGHEEYDSR